MTIQPADFAEDLEAGIAAARKAHVGKLGSVPLAWLVLMPVWTDELAAATGFPAKPLDRQTFLAECERLGWCVRRPASAAGRREDTAEILLLLVETLRQVAADGDAWQLAVGAAGAAIDAIAVPAARESARGRLAELGVPLALPARPPADRGDTVSRLIAEQAWSELDELLIRARPADVQRMLLRHAAELPAATLEAAARRVAAESTPRAAARVLATAAPSLPSASTGLLISLILPRFRLTDRGAEAIVAHLAMAAGYAGDSALALKLCERLSDDLLRAQALAVLVGVQAAGPDRAQIAPVVDRIARVIVAGEGVDLAGAAEAVTRLASSGAIAAAAPITSTAAARLQVGELSATDVGALVKLATALRQAGGRAQAEVAMFVNAAITAALRIGDPATKAAGLARVLSVVHDDRREALLADARSAARQVADAAERARSLVRLVEQVPPGQLTDVVAELISALPPADPGSAFWTPESARPAIVGELEQANGLPWLRSTAATVGTRILGLSQPGLVPSAARRWAVLAATLKDQRDLGNQTGDALLQQVEPLLRSGHTAEALGWIDTGRRLLGIIEGTFDTSLLVAARRVELVQRTLDDRRLLQRFLRRKDQVDAFREVLNTPDDEEPWALHYLGQGGVGKTMLLRHIAAELAPAEHLIMARVDFDNLSPDFPLRRPAQLLLVMLEELEAYADSDTRGLYEEARTFLRYQEWWREGTSAARSAGSAAPTLDHAVQRFCAYLRALGSRIVLVLDTCEELAKFEPTGAVLPQLDAAFRLIERIQQEVPAVRVIFAGRRPLARVVHGGRSLDPQRMQLLDRLPAEKTYLQVHEIVGFEREEARTYLRDMEGLSLDRGMWRDLLTRSRDRPHEPYYSGSRPGWDAPRHVPFDLAQYAAALREDPSYLRNHPHNVAYVAYVRDRIVGRQGPFTAQLLPAVVAMRRFDQDMLAVAVQHMAVTWEEAWQELTATEWITAHVDDALQTTVLEVDRTMLDRLEAYYRTGDQRAESDRARSRVGTGLSSLVRTKPLHRLAVDHVDAALRCLPDDQAASLCDDLALRVAEEQDAWMWAYIVFGRVLGLDGALASVSHPARASAQALFVTALSQVGPAEDLTDQWREIAGLASRHPQPLVARWLAARSAVLAEPGDSARWDSAMQLVTELLRGGRDDHRRAAWLAGSVLAAVCTALDQAVSHQRRPEARRWKPVLAGRVIHKFGPHVSAMASALLGRGLMLDDEEYAASGFFAQALNAVRAAPADLGPADAAADGAVPANARDRVRLEALLAGLAGDRDGEWLSSAVQAVKRCTDAGHPADPDSDRLAALLLGRLLDERLPSADQLAQIQAAVGSMTPSAATTLSHRQVPPLRVALSRGWLALADVSRARAALDARGAFAGTAEQRSLDLARVEIARRMRLPKSDPAVRSALRESCSVVEALRVYEAATLLGEDTLPPPTLARPPAYLHAWWRVTADPLHTMSYQELVTALRVAPSWCPPGQPSAREALVLDGAELTMLGQVGWDAGTLTAAQAEADLGWYRQQRARQEEAWRLALRRAALQREAPPAGVIEPPQLAGLRRPAMRRLAELAFEEGELLALRLPVPGARLLAGSTAWFAVAGDPTGCLLAHIAECLARARSSRSSPDLTRLRASYAAACKVVRSLPDWTALADETRYAKALSEMPTDALSAWEGWLLRLRWLLDGPGAAGRELNLSTTAVPPELRPRGPERSAHQPPLLVTQIRSATTTRMVLRKLTRAGSRTAVSVLVGGISGICGAAAGAGLILLYGIFSDAVSQLPVLRITALRIGLYVVAVIGLPWAGTRIARSGPRYSWASARIASGRDPSTVSVALTSRVGRRWPLRSQTHRCQQQVRMLGPGSPDLGKTPAHELLAAAARDDRPLRVSLHIARPLAGIAWEAWLASPLEENVRLQIGRPYRRLLATGPERRRGFDGYLVLAPQRWRGLVRNAAGGEAVQFLGRFPAGAAGDVLIIVGIGVDTPAGPRLVIHNAHADGDLVVDPDEADVTSLTVIVVGEPRGESRLGPVTDSAAALRACAADLIEAGSRTVVVVPNTPAAVASDVLTSLADSIRPGTAQTARSLSAAVEQARQVLAKETDRQLSYQLTVLSRVLP